MKNTSSLVLGASALLFALGAGHVGCSSFGDEPEEGSIPPSGDAGSDTAAVDGPSAVEGGATVDAESDGPTVNPAACDPATCGIVFVTSATTNGDIGDIEGADELCAAATSAGVPRVQGKPFKAWISTSSIQANTRFSKRKLEYRRLDGTIVAKDMDTIVAKGLDAVINQTETGGVAAGVEVWTGTLPTGTRTPDTCGSWDDASTTLTGRVGRTDATDAFWTNATAVPCNTKAHVYCFEDP